jgi:TRAP-type C4-dicarboxylate transport system permease small subunit
MMETQNRAKRIEWLEGVIVAALILMTLVLLLQVFARYVAKISIPWTEELARYLLVLMTFTGAALALRDKQHIAITFLLERLPDTPRICFELFFNVVIMLFLGAVFRGSLTMVDLTWETPAGTIPWITTGKLYLILPFATLIMLGYLLAQVFQAAKRLSAQLGAGGTR